MSTLLDNLNPEQLAAVTLPSQHALILAGAGSGKTRVLTTRIAWLIQTGNAGPNGLLAVTFTNKAAKEMLTRISSMLPINIRGMWVGTFHGLCNRLLRAHHREANLPQLFQILDSQDQIAAVKRVLRAMNVDEERFPPRQVAYFISAAKDEGKRPGNIEISDEFTRRAADFYAAYDEQCQKEGVVDFAELLLRSYELLARNEPLREHYQARFKHILVDEFQDTNRLQYRWLRQLAGRDNTLFAVGDDDQCVVKGTAITMADGSRLAVEKVRPGDMLRSAYGSGDFRAARVERVYKRSRKDPMVAIHTRAGRKLTTTPEHTHFAGYLLGQTPQTYFVYLMVKRGIGFRLGTSQVYTRGQARPMVGFKQRSLQEHADALWVIGTHANENEARAEEVILSLQYGLPTLPFVPRKGKAKNGLVHDADYISRVFDTLDTVTAAKRLIADRGLSLDEPHHSPQSRNSNRRNVMVTLCGDHRGAHPMHRISVLGNDADGRRALVAAGFSVRKAKADSASWRFETCRKDFGELMKQAEAARRALNGKIILKANLNGETLPFISAGSVRPGMVMVDESGKFDVVESVAREKPRAREVYDLDVTPTHNFVANGLVTHNSIYRFRGANVGNMADFERDYKVQNVIRLEQNYRSHGNILAAANALIAHNNRRLGKNLWTAEGEGEPIRVFEAASDGYEAAWLVEEVQALSREGMAYRDMAILYRSNAQSRLMEHALFSNGIAYRVYGGQRFFERVEIKHALAYLRLLANSDDDGAFLRIVNFPTRGIGARSIEQLQDAALASGSSLYKAVPQVAGKAGSSLAAFVRIVESLRQETADLQLPEVVGALLERSGLVAHYQSERDGADRVENLGELVNAATYFMQEEGSGDLATFLAHAALESGENQAAEGMDALQMMTVHSAKGLEFHAVFLTGLEEGLFPHEQSVNEDDGLEEERRLAYVAVTRARTRLYLSFAQTRMLHGQTRYNIASRFLDEIPDGLMKWLTPRLGSGLAREAAWEPQVQTQTFAPRVVQKESGHGFRIGQSVQHAKFGQGVIVSAEGSGKDARLQINFGREGMKWLALEYAKLEAV